MPDPNIAAAIREIQAILNKHDLAAIFALSSPSHTHWLYELSPTWSCATVETDPAKGVGIRVRCERKDFLTKADQQKCLEQTTGMIMGFHTVTMHTVAQLNNLIMVLGSHFDIEHMDRLDPPER